MEIVEFGALTDERRAQLEGEEADPFDAAALERAFEFRRKERHVALADGGRLVASTGLLVIEARAGAREFPVVGIGGVLVVAGRRGEGLGRRIVEAALERAATLGPRFALLFCRDDRAGLYDRLGFSALPPPVTVEQPGGEAIFPLRAMWRALAPGARWPPGPVHVLSRPF